MNNALLDFLRENLQRLFIKMPKFFKVWGWISTVLILITSLPALITMLPGDVKIPDLLNRYLTTGVRWAASGMLLMAFFTTQSKPIAVTTSGTVIKETDEKDNWFGKKLPFTVADEKKFAAKEAVPVVKIKPANDIKSINHKI